MLKKYEERVPITTMPVACGASVEEECDSDKLEISLPDFSGKQGWQDVFLAEYWRTVIRKSYRDWRKNFRASGLIILDVLKR